jgi:hypothetical protein
MKSEFLNPKIGCGVHEIGERQNGGSIPTGLYPSAQGCDEGATLGSSSRRSSIPTGLHRPLVSCCNPVGVGHDFGLSPRVASQARRPWAECWNPVGIRSRKEFGKGRAWLLSLSCCGVPPRLRMPTHASPRSLFVWPGPLLVGRPRQPKGSQPTSRGPGLGERPWS